MKRCISVVCILAFSIFLFCGCQQAEDPKNALLQEFAEPRYEWGAFSGKTLELWNPERELDRVYMQRAFRRYEEKTGNRLQVVGIPKDSFTETTAAALSSGRGKPDLLLSYGGTNVRSLDPDRNFMDLTDAVWVQDLTDTSINQTIYNGRVIGLPHWEASISGMLYNKKLFAKHGIEVPETQKDFQQACKTLLSNGITPVYLPGQAVTMLLYQFPLDYLLEDESVLSGLNTGLIGYDDLPQMEIVADWYREMARKGYFGENYRSNDWDGMDEAMKSGDYAMMLCWDTWLYTDFTGNPNDFGLMPAFMGIPENGTFEGPNLALLIVNRRSNQTDVALDFLTFLADPCNYNAAFDGIYTAPVFKNQVASISTPQYAEAERNIERNYRDSTAWLRVEGFSQMDASCLLDYMEVSDGTTARQCLAQMERLRKARIASAEDGEAYGS